MLARVVESSRAAFSSGSQCRRLATEVALPDMIPGLYAGVLLARSPFLTQKPGPFEAAYYDYQVKLKMALSNPFPQSFYFKPGSPLEKKFVLEEKKREDWLFNRPISIYHLKKLNEEIKSASDVVDEQFVAEKRKTAADVFQNQKSLNRSGDRTLYLVVQRRGAKTLALPHGDVIKGELLHDATRRIMGNTLGKNMDTWMVGRIPVGFHERKSKKGVTSKTFFFKSHILAGQVELNESMYSDFFWLTKEEMALQLPKEYWDSVSDMLSEI